MKKILIYGMGNVGKNLLFYLSRDKDLEIGIIDRNKERCKAIVLDFLPFETKVIDATVGSLADYELLFVTAGIKDESNRKLYIKDSKEMLDGIFSNVILRGFKGNVIIISNPTDVLSTYAFQNYHNDFKNILSTGTIIDSLRLKALTNKEIKLYGLHGKDCVSYFDEVNEDDLKEALDVGYEIQKLGFNSSFGISLAAKRLMDYLDGKYVESFVASKYNTIYNSSFSHDLVLDEGVVKSVSIDETNPNFLELKKYIEIVIKEVN